MAEPVGIQPERLVKIEEETPGKETGGNYGAETIAWTAPPGVSMMEVELKLPIAMLSAAIETKGLTDGDLVALCVAPKTTVGALPSDVAAGATTIPLPATMKGAYQAGLIWVGQVIHLDDGTNEDALGLLLAVDEEEDTFDILLETEHAFAAATPTLVKLTTSMSPGILNNCAEGCGWVELKAHGALEEFGTSKIGGTRIDKGKKIVPRFTNTGAESVRVVIRLEFLY